MKLFLLVPKRLVLNNVIIMLMEITEIKQNEQVEYYGDVVIFGDIGSHSKITIKDGSLIINGSISDNVNIIFQEKSHNVGSFFLTPKLTEILGNYIKFGTRYIHAKRGFGNKITIQSKCSTIIIDRKPTAD